MEWGRNGTSILPGVPTQSSDAGVPRRGCPQAEALSAGEANPEGAGAGALPDHMPQETLLEGNLSSHFHGHMVSCPILVC